MRFWKGLKKAWNNWRRDRQGGTPYDWRKDLCSAAERTAIAHDPRKIREELGYL
jgi:hypothetical protein